MSLFDWIPQQRLWGLDFWGSQFRIACAPLVILCCLSLSRRWARFTDSPSVFALVYGVPFFLLTFQDSLGDSIQMIDGIHARYYMSEPAASWVHYWLFRFLHEPFNVGAKYVIALSSRLAGLAYLWVVARISIRLFPELDPSRRLVYRLMFFTAGVTLLFYGYIENPPLGLPAEQLWVLTSIALLQSPTVANISRSGAALALATALHGRAAFLFPAFIAGCCIPPASVRARVKRAALGAMVFFGLLAIMVAYIFLVDSKYISGGPWGNVLGGGNNQMFVPLHLLFDKSHWQPLLVAIFIAGGVLLPCGLIPAASALFRRDAFSLWALAYLLSDVVYVFFWEFDYGPLIDFDLVFSGVGPLLLLAAITVARSRIPVFLLLPFLVASAIVSMAFATVVNGGPLPLNVVPRAGLPAPDGLCAHPGLRRTYFSDPQLTMPVGPPQPDVPIHEYGPAGIPFPTPGKPFGGAFEGYIRIPSKGRYRFHILAQGNLRLKVAAHMLFERWTGFEWRITSEREMKFSKAGWYPIRLEFFSTVPGFPVQLALESSGQEKRTVSSDELCHE